MRPFWWPFPTPPFLTSRSFQTRVSGLLTLQVAISLLPCVMCMHCFSPAMTSLFLAPCTLLVTPVPGQPSAPCSVALPFLTHGPLCLSRAGQGHLTTKGTDLSYGTELMKPAAKPLKPSASSYSGCQRTASLTQSPKGTIRPRPRETTFLSP